MINLNIIYRLLDKMQFGNEWYFNKGAFQILRGPLLPLLMTIAVVGMGGVVLMGYLDISIWRHDSFQYTLDKSWYLGNLKGEGRWVNYFFFDLIKMVPAKIAAIASLLSLALYGYLCTSNLFKNRYQAVILGVSLILLPVVHAQNLWPNITMVPSIALLLFYFLSKKVHPFILFGLAAIFYFGSLSQFYFFIPLIYLNDINNSVTGKFRDDAIYVLGRVVIPYCLCFIIGFLVANGIVFFETGDRIKLGGFRKPTPVTDFNQLQVNLSKIHKRFFQFYSTIFSTSYQYVWIALIPMLLISLNKKSIWILLVLSIMLLSPFYTTVYHGVIISQRTMMPTIIPFFIIFLLLPGLKIKSNLLHLILCLLLIFPFYKDSSDHLSLFSKIGNYYRTQISQAMTNFPPQDVQGIAVLITNQELAKINSDILEHTNQNFKWSERFFAVNRTVVPSLRSLGYQQISIMNDANAISQVKAQIQNESRKEPFIAFPVNRPKNYGLILNNSKLDTVLFMKG